MKYRSKLLLTLIAVILALSLSLCSCDVLFGDSSDISNHIPNATLDSIPPFDGKTPYVTINENVPFLKQTVTGDE